MAKNNNLEREILNQKKDAQRRKRASRPPKVANLLKDYSENLNKPPRGKPTGVCTKCGKEFDQQFSEDRNAYSSFKTCPECRAKLSKKKEEKLLKDSQDENIIVKKLPYTPYPWQEEAEEAFWQHRFTVLSCGNRCLFKGAFINGADKPIEQLSKKDKVISKEGELQKITNLWTEQYNGDIYTIKGVGIEPIRCTDNHPLMIAYGRKKNRDARPEIYDEKLVCANEIQQEQAKLNRLERLYLKIPRVKGFIDCINWKFEKLDKNYPNQLDDMPINEDTAWLLGLYCAEGCYNKKAGCKWTLNYNEPELATHLCNILDSLGLHYNIRERENEGTRCIVVTKMQFCRKLDLEVGHGSTNKKIPADILYNKNKKLLVSFLKGYYAGDGYCNEKTVVLNATTVSRTLAQQLQTAWARLGYFAKISSHQRNRVDKNNNLVNPEYIVTISAAEAIRLLDYNIRDKKELKTAIITDNAIYTKLYSVECEQGEETIYGISTYDETFTSNGVINRNTGKDRFSMMVGIKYFVECLNENRHVYNPELVPSVYWWIVAPTEKMALQNWRELKKFFPQEWVVACSDSSFTMETIGGGIIEVRSGYDEQSLVGVGIDLCTVTEAARFKDLNVAWAHLEARLSSEGRGLKRDRTGHAYGQGKAIINSSPLGKNDFYDLWCRGQKDNSYYSSEWWSAQYPWTANPTNFDLAQKPIQTKYGVVPYEQTIRQQIGEQKFRSNYLADFTAELANVFRNFEERCVYNPFSPEYHFDKQEIDRIIKKWQDPVPGSIYIGGYDPATGSSGDSPAFVIREKSSNRVVRVFDLYGKSYEQQYDFIAAMCKRYNYAALHWLRTGHTAIEGQFEKRGIIEVPLDEQGAKKGQLVQTLELAVENGDIQIIYDGSPEIQTLIFQMNDYSEKNGKYSNDKVPHDDFVSALYAAFSDYNFEEVPIAYCGLMGAV